jgi:hypothetical protein
MAAPSLSSKPLEPDRTSELGLLHCKAPCAGALGCDGQCLMPQRPRLATGGLAYHVLNRCVSRLPLFRKPADYLAFEKILQGKATFVIDLLLDVFRQIVRTSFRPVDVADGIRRHAFRHRLFVGLGPDARNQRVH